MKRNWSILVWFELLYRMILYIILYPAQRAILLKALDLAGTTYISQENFTLLLHSPRSILMLLSALILLLFFIYLEITGLLLCFEAGWEGRRITLRHLLVSTFKRSFRLFRPRNLLLFAGLLPLLALSWFRLSSSVLSSFQIPEFILEYIQADTFLYALYCLVLILANLYLFFYFFGLPETILHEKAFSKSLRSARSLLKGKRKRALAVFILCLLSLAFLAVAAAALLILILFAYAKFFYPASQAAFVFEEQCILWFQIGSILLEILSTAVILAVTLSLYHVYLGDTLPAMQKLPFKASRIFRKAAAALCTLAALLIFSETEYSGHLMIPADSSVQIVAHRAGAGFAPENTAAALEESIRDGTDWAEIDVQQTKDGTLIIMHDSNFKRTAGLDQNVWDTDYETVQSLDAGSSFSPQFSGEPIPTLEDMLSRAQNRINLMIELKYTGHEDKLVEKTVSLIEKYHMEKQCMIVSMNLSLLKEVKQHTRRVKTGYVSALLVTDSYDLEYIDAYSVETTSLTFQMAADAHYQRKLIYAWTANSPKTMKKILSLQADGLITDNPLLARYYLEDSGENSLLDLLKEIFFPNAA